MGRPGFVLEVDDRTPPLLVPDGDRFRLEKFPLGTRVIYPVESLPRIPDLLEAINAALDAPLTDELLERSLARRPTALVLVETASFGRNGAPPARDPALLKLQAAGVPVATIRKGDDLAAKLGGFEGAYAAHG